MPIRNLAPSQTMAISSATPRDEMEGETQELDQETEIYGDTEAMDDGEEESERTVELGGENERLDEDSTQCTLPLTACLGESGEENGRLDEVSSQRTLPLTACFGESEEKRFSSGEVDGSGLIKKSFAEVRIESLRASGLAASKKSSPTIKEGQCMETSKIRNVGNSARKLNFEKETSDLSYIFSQEKMQEDALEAVDKFLQVNDVGLSQNLHGAKRVDVKRSPVLRAKGLNTLLKLNAPRSSISKNRTFDWVNSLEDETGGEFFTKKRDSIFGNTKNSKKSKVKKITGNSEITPSDEAMCKIGEGRGGEFVKKKRNSIFGNTKNSKKSKVEEITGNSEYAPIHEAMCEIGPDTQIAAEGMEALCFETFPTCKDITGNPKYTLSKKDEVRRSLRLKNSREDESGKISQGKMKEETAVLSKQCLPVLSKPRTRRRNAAHAEKVTGQWSTVSDRTRTDDDGPKGNSVLSSENDHAIPIMRESAEMDIEERENHAFYPTSASPTLFSKEISLRRRSLRSVEIKQLVGNTRFTPDGERKQCVSILTKPRTRRQNAAQAEKLQGQWSAVSAQTKIDDDGSKGNFVLSTENDHAVHSMKDLAEKDEDRENHTRYPTLHSKETSVRRKSLGSRELKQLVGNTVLTPDGSYKPPRRDMGSIRVYLSHHLDDVITKKQKKIMAYMGISYVNSVSEASHFVANKFIRTRNMLEAMAAGKPVVTSQWLESCRQGRCIVQEKDYILRDKEREMSFCMPDSLSRSLQSPLFEGKRVFITPHVKPSRELVADVVRAAKGQVVERVRRRGLKDHSSNMFENLLVISCKEDRTRCIPFIESGMKVFSAELVLSGIVTQRLDYESYRIFSDPVKRSRSRIMGNKPKKRKCS